MSRTAKITGVFLLALVAALVYVGWRLLEFTNHKQAPQTLGEQLIEKLDRNDTAGARQILNMGVDVTFRQENTSRTALMAAAALADGELVKSLIKRGADVNATDYSGASPLNFLLSSGHATPAMVSALLPRTPALRRGGGTGSSPMLLAVQTHDPHIVDILLKAGANSNDRDASLKPLIIDAVEIDDLQMVKEFVANHADVNASGPQGERALQAAIKIGNEQIAKYLVAHGADINKRDASGDTPLIAATAENQANLVKSLLAAGARVDAKNKRGETALIIAARDGRAPIVDSLLQAHADAALRDNTKRSALVWATEQSFTDIRKSLQRQGMGTR